LSREVDIYAVEKEKMKERKREREKERKRDRKIDRKIKATMHKPKKRRQNPM
jgi:hypothetical protein